MQQKTQPLLERGLTFWQATSINMIDMVGIGPFVTIPLIVKTMHGPGSLFAWLLGAVLALTDGLVWAELGAQWPEAGGSYAFLQRLYGHTRIGKLMPFLFTWQTTIQAPLVIASGAIGFSHYFGYLAPISGWQQHALSGLVVILIVVILYRDIRSIGKISLLLWVITGGTILWLIGSGIGRFSAAQAFHFNMEGLNVGSLFYVALGNASVNATYSYLGYYNVCHLGAEIKNPVKNIPRAIITSILGIAVLYIAMQTIIVGVMPWQSVAGSEHIVSTYIEEVYHSHALGILATLLVLFICVAGLFSAILGYSRIPYAAALNGDFFPVFARVHPKYKFPHLSLLAIGAMAFVFSLLFKLGDVIKAILMMRILIQFVMQAVGLIAWRYRQRGEKIAFRMPLFPLPAIISIGIWLFLFFYNPVAYRWYAVEIIVTGIAAFLLKNQLTKKKNRQVV